jgi:hypothetical protein
MIIGYSYWGFLGHGVTDTPDGGRSHRLTFVNGIRARGHEMVFLQRDRDTVEAGESFAHLGRWSDGLPSLDALILEWRWPIPGRSVGIPADAPAYCPDWDRQRELVAHYVVLGRTPTLVWDKDLKLPHDAALRSVPWVRMAEATRFPSPGAVGLLFPIDDQVFADRIAALATTPPAPARYVLGYVGNRYERDEDFDQFFAGPAHELEHAVFGKWAPERRWRHVRFLGRLGFSRVPVVYRHTVATVLLAPRRYRESGQITQRIFEAQLNGCFTIAPRSIRGAADLLPEWLLASHTDDVVRICRDAERVRGGDGYPGAIVDCVRRLEPFLLSRQLDALASALAPLGVDF